MTELSWQHQSVPLDTNIEPALAAIEQAAAHRIDAARTDAHGAAAALRTNLEQLRVVVAERNSALQRAEAAESACTRAEQERDAAVQRAEAAEAALAKAEQEAARLQRAVEAAAGSEEVAGQASEEVARLRAALIEANAARGEADGASAVLRTELEQLRGEEMATSRMLTQATEQLGASVGAEAIGRHSSAHFSAFYEIATGPRNEILAAGAALGGLGRAIGGIRAAMRSADGGRGSTDVAERRWCGRGRQAGGSCCGARGAGRTAVD